MSDTSPLHLVPPAARLTRNPVNAAWNHVLAGVDAALSVPHLPADQAAVLHRVRRSAAILAAPNARPRRRLRSIDHESEA